MQQRDSKGRFVKGDRPFIDHLAEPSWDLVDTSRFVQPNFYRFGSIRWFKQLWSNWTIRWGLR